MLMSSSIALSAFVENVWACLALFALAYASLWFAGANVWTLVGEVAPTLAVAGALCIVGALSYLFVVGKVEPLPVLRGHAGNRNAEPSAA